MIGNHTRAAVHAHLAARYGIDALAFRPLADAAAAGAPVQPAGDLFADAIIQSLPVPPWAVQVLNRLSYGATLASMAEFNALGTSNAARLTAYVDRQLNWAAIDDSAVEARLANAGYGTLQKSVQRLWADHIRNPEWQVRMRPAWECQRAALVRAVHSKRQLHELMVDFWHNHFNVLGTDYDAGPMFPQLDRVIRQGALGNFRSLLGGVTQSTSMLYYLDNRSNTREGPNENFARELLELHTFGAENYLGFVDPFEVPPCPEDPRYPIGYTDIDVYETASAFTGWSVRNGHWEFPTEDDGTFAYRSIWHDAGPKFVLGKFLYPEQPPMKDGQDILSRLATHPRVARYICRKLIRRFLTDDPPQSLVDSAAVVFRNNATSSQQIRMTLRHILLSATATATWGAKRKRPFEAVASALRVLASNWTPRVGDQKTDELFWHMGYTGHLPYEWPAPNGYPDAFGAWSGSSTFVSEWRVLNWLTETTNGASPLCPVMTVTRASVPASQWTATRLVQHWCMRVLGHLPDETRRQALVAFLAQNGDPNTYVIADTDAWSASDPKRHYNQQRIRSMVALVLMTPEFLAR